MGRAKKTGGTAQGLLTALPASLCVGLATVQMLQLPARRWISAGDLPTISGEKPVEEACGYWEMRQLAALHNKEAGVHVRYITSSS